MNTRTIIVLTMVLVLLGGFDYLEAWTKPNAAAPAANVAAPLNTSGAKQIKTGALGTGSLDITGIQQITSPNPLIRFTDSDSGAMSYRTIVNADRMFIQVDRNKDGSFTAADPATLMTFATGATTAGDFAVFSNQVRANAYCDKLGGNCFQASDVTGGVTLTAGQNAYTCPVIKAIATNNAIESSCTGQLQLQPTCTWIKQGTSGSNSGGANTTQTVNCTPAGRLIQ